jgi:FkbM family methyltransferase
MNSDAIRHSFKRVLPSPAVRTLARVRQYLHRISAWARMMSELKGRTAADSVILWRSLARSPLDLFYDLDRWREPSLDADAEVVCKGLGAFAVRRRTDDLGNISPANFSKSFDCIRQYVCEGDVTIDAGANLGAVTVYMSRLVGPRGRVIAVEMMPDTAALLRYNLELNAATNVAVVELALAERAGETVVACLESGFHGQASIAKRSARSDRDIEVRTTTLQSLMNGIEEVALLKLDLEGAEAQALRGAGDAIGRIRAILFESWAADGGDTARLLRDAGFGIAAVDCRNFIARREQTPWPPASIETEGSNECLWLLKAETSL